MNKLSVIEGPTVSVPPFTIASATANCPPGQRATGGGFFSSITEVGGAVPTFTGSSYFVIVNNTTGITVDINAYAICVAP